MHKRDTDIQKENQKKLAQGGTVFCLLLQKS